MKRKLTYLLGLLLTTSAVLAQNNVEYEVYSGTRDNPMIGKTPSLLTINPSTTYSQDLPTSPYAGATVYSIDAGRDYRQGNSSSARGLFTYIPTTNYPYLIVWFAIEKRTGVHTVDMEPEYETIYIYTENGDTLPCSWKDEFIGDSMLHTVNFIKSTIFGTDYWYRNWQPIYVDLSNYVGKQITVSATAYTCSTHSCNSYLYLAFDTPCKYLQELCSTCETPTTIKAPSIYPGYAWSKLRKNGPVISTDSVCPIDNPQFTYYCTLNGGYCGTISLQTTPVDVITDFNYNLHCGDEVDTVYFTNNSFVQRYVYPNYRSACDAYYWDFGNGQTSTQRNPGYVLFDKGKQYTVRLRTGTEDFACDAWSDATFRTCDPEDSIPLNPLPLIPVTDSIDSVVCHGTIVEWRDMSLTETGIYRDTLISKTWGTDSIYYVLNLTVLAEPVEIPLLDTASCQMIPFLWRGHAIVGDTTCYDTLRTTKLGCDSIYASLHFVVKEPSSSDTTAYTCYGTPFIWHGKVAQDGDTIMRKNVFGCDSIVTLKLFVSEAPVTIPLKDTASCQLVPFLWRGHQITSDTLCYDTLRTTKLGCDSIYASLRFVVKEPTASDTFAYVCYEDLPFIWHGKEAKDGDTIIRKNVAGCDSIVTLRLTTSSKPIVWNIDTTICDTLLPYKWREQNFTAIYTYRDTIYNARGCDSIYRSFTLDTVHCVRPEPPVPPEPPVDTCVSNLVYRKWVDFIFCDNGRDEFVAFQWYRNNQYLAGETGQYLYLPGTMGAAEYFVEATKTDGTKIRTCPLIFDNTPRSRDTYVKVPTVIRRGQPLQIAMSDPEADIAIYTVVGQPVLSAHILGPETSLPIPLPAGTYVLRLIGANINTTTKILIE